jgi:hypothetical protein
MLDPACIIDVGLNATMVGASRFFADVLLEDVLERLAAKVGRHRHVFSMLP